MLLQGETKGSKKLATLIPKLQRRLWDTEIEVVCAEIFRRTRLARQALKQLEPQKPQLLEALLHPLDAAAKEALAGRIQAKQFLRAYNKA